MILSADTIGAETGCVGRRDLRANAPGPRSRRTTRAASGQRWRRPFRHSCAASCCALASCREAQYLRMRSATALRCSSVMVRLRLTSLRAFFLPLAAAGGAVPSIASIARCIATSLGSQRPLLVAQSFQDSAPRHVTCFPFGGPATRWRRPRRAARTYWRRRCRSTSGGSVLAIGAAFRACSQWPRPPQGTRRPHASRSRSTPARRTRTIAATAASSEPFRLHKARNLIVVSTDGNTSSRPPPTLRSSTFIGSSVADKPDGARVHGSSPAA